MKNSVKLHSLCLVILVIFLHSCKKEELPTLSTSTISNITANSASGGGNITSDGGAEVKASGVCWGAAANPTTSESKTSENVGTGQFVSNITGLTAGLTYHVRAYATNSVGIAYGADLSFATLGKAPECITQAATNISASGATLNGTVNANDLSTTVTFEYGTTTSYGITATATQSPVTGNTNTNVSADIIGLTAGTIYHFRVKAVNTLGTVYGSDMTFSTLGKAPSCSTQPVTNVSTNGATLNGTVNANGLSTTVSFEYGTTSSYGSTATATQSPVTGNTNTNVSADISGLTLGMTYHCRAKAINSIGTTNGSDVIFTTTSSTSVTDIDGNIYNTVIIGTQVWMAENLKTTKYDDGTAISNVTNNTTWAGLTTGAYCWYNNNAIFQVNYGALYNWYTVSTGKLCPTDWHVPSDAEWTTLTTFLGGYSVAGGKLKETGTTHWISPNTGATNETGFTARPGGYRNYNGTGTFVAYGGGGVWWSSDDNAADHGISRSMTYNSSSLNWGSGVKQVGASVRCLRDN